MDGSDGQTRPDDGSEPTFRLRDTDLAARGFEDETIVLDLRSSHYLSTNATGTALWRELERGATRTQLVTALLDAFEVEELQAAADVDAFLDSCRQRSLLTTADDAASGHA